MMYCADNVINGLCGDQMFFGGPKKKKISKKGNNKREWIKLLITVQNLMVSRNFDDAQRREVKIQLIDTSLMYGLY